MSTLRDKFLSLTEERQNKILARSADLIKQELYAQTKNKEIPLNETPPAPDEWCTKP